MYRTRAVFNRNHNSSKQKQQVFKIEDLTIFLLVLAFPFFGITNGLTRLCIKTKCV